MKENKRGAGERKGPRDVKGGCALSLEESPMRSRPRAGRQEAAVSLGGRVPLSQREGS